MTKPILTRALRDTLELQSAAARFFGALAQRASVPTTRKLLLDFARVEQLLALEVEAMTSQLTDAALPDRANTRVAGIKTAPEWSAVQEPTFEQSIAIALDCTRRAFHHHTDTAHRLDGRPSSFFLNLAQSEQERASMLDSVLAKRLAKLIEGHDVSVVFAETLDTVRRAGKAYARMAARTSRARTREFLKGMVEVCSLHAANIQAFVPHARELDERDRVFDDLLSVCLPVLDGPLVELDFISAMRMAMEAQKRAALVHGMLARVLDGDEAQQLLDVAEAERRHAATIASVLDRMAPEAEELDSEPVSPLADAPRQSWTCPPQIAQAEQYEPPAPSLRLVAG